MDDEQRERYLTLRIITIRTRDGITGDTFSGPRGAIEVFTDNPQCDVTVTDPRRVPWWRAQKPTVELANPDEATAPPEAKTK